MRGVLGLKANVMILSIAFSFRLRFTGLQAVKGWGIASGVAGVGLTFI